MDAQKPNVDPIDFGLLCNQANILKLSCVTGVE